MPRSSSARKIPEKNVMESVNVNAIDLLESQHREVEKLFDEFEQLGERAFKARMQVFEKISHKLTCHTLIEEKLFYPAGKKADKHITLEAYEEHDLVKGLIKKIAALEAGDETFLAKVTVLKEIVQHHVKEEEGEYFPKVKKDLGEEALMELGGEMAMMFERLDSQHPEPTHKYLKRAK